jgi:hypothetical protein
MASLRKKWRDFREELFHDRGSDGHALKAEETGFTVSPASRPEPVPGTHLDSDGEIVLTFSQTPSLFSRRKQLTQPQCPPIRAHLPYLRAHQRRKCHKSLRIYHPQRKRLLSFRRRLAKLRLRLMPTTRKTLPCQLRKLRNTHPRQMTLLHQRRRHKTCRRRHSWHYQTKHKLKSRS